MAAANPTGKLQGFKSTFHYTPAGGGAAVKLKSVSEWKLSIKADAIDASDHDTQGWKEKLTGMAEWSASVKAVYYEGDTTQQGMLTALFNALVNSGGNLACTFEPIDQAGGLAYSGSAIVTGFDHSAGNSDAQGLDLTLTGTGPISFAVQATAD